MFNIFKKVKLLTILTIAMGALNTGVNAGPLMDRIENGDPIRLGFAIQPPSAYSGTKGEMLGFANVITVNILKKMGYDNVEPVVTDWGGMVPALVANRADIVTGGMYILNSRCNNVMFSEPIAKQYDGFFVKKGNPKGINNYSDIKNSNAIMVSASGTNNREAALKVGVKDNNIMTVPGNAEMLAAVKAGRADAAALPFVEVERMVSQHSDILSASNPNKMPEWTINYTGIVFRPSDADFVEKFNAALAEYIGSPEMLASVKDQSYTDINLPADVTTKWACSNR